MTTTSNLRLPNGGMTMLFQKDIEPRCAYCKRGITVDGDQVMCVKKGLVSPADSCRRFKYDPLKRTPPRPLAVDFSRLSEEDFSL